MNPFNLYTGNSIGNINPSFFTPSVINLNNDPDELQAKEFKQANINNTVVSAYDLLNLSRESQKAAQEFFKFIAQNSQYLSQDSKKKIDRFILESKKIVASFQEIQSVLNQKVDEQKAVENRKSLQEQFLDVRQILYSLCDLRTLGKLYLTSKMTRAESINLLIEKVKGLKSYRFQCDLLWKNRSSLGCASSWIKNAEKINCLRFICALDSKWLECLSAAGDKEIEELFIDDLRPIAISDSITEFKQVLFARRIKSLNLRIAFNEICYNGRGLMPGPMGVAKPLSGEHLIPSIFAALPDELSSLEISGESIDHNPLEETVNALTSFGHLPCLNLKKLVMKKWAIKNSIDESISFKFFHSSLRELRVTQSMNTIKNSDIEDLPNLEILEMDGSLGLTSRCFEKLPRSVTQLFITVWPVKVPRHMVPTKYLNQLSPGLKVLRLSVLTSDRGSIIPTQHTPKYELKFKHIQSLPQGLTSLECTWRKEVAEENIRSHLTNLVELKRI